MNTSFSVSQIKKLAAGFFSLGIPLSFLLLISGCSAFNGTRLEGLLGGEENLIRLSYAIADELEQQAFPPLIPRNPEQPILTTTFVNNDNLQETSKLGRILQEHISSRFVQRGYTVMELKLRSELQVQEASGETMLSRDITELKPTQTAQALIIGTYTLSSRNLYLSARLVNPASGIIIASTDYKIVMDDNILAMFGLQLTPHDDINLISEPKPSLMTRLLYGN